MDVDRPSTWKKYRPSMCNGCWGGCCTMPVEIRASDLVRMELCTEDEAQGSLKKIANRLISKRIIKSFRASTGLFTLEQKRDRSCYFLGEDRLCTMYEKRPDVCRRFPEIGPRPGFCPAKQK